MFDEDGAAVLNDFDSRCWVGESLNGTAAGRTSAWHDPDVEVASVKNDIDAFQELKTSFI